MKTEIEKMSAGSILDGSCHCTHVTYLNDRLTELETIVKNARAPTYGQPTGGVHGGIAPRADEASHAETPGATHQDWNMFTPLRERPLGMISGSAPYKNIMDDKLMANTDYMYDGNESSVWT